MSNITHTVAIPSAVAGIDMADMLVGSIAVLLVKLDGGDMEVGDIIMRTYTSWVVLESPNKTWTVLARDLFKVQLLDEGTIITITVGEQQ